MKVTIDESTADVQDHFSDEKAKVDPEHQRKVINDIDLSGLASAQREKFEKCSKKKVMYCHSAMMTLEI